ncbi:propionyl-CoA carboxylase [Mycobacteroides abscessus subsp. abscessus]|nr:propionyl-CoA carboxylase [Mycobacteroides abscessus subsp. abscessus]
MLSYDYTVLAGTQGALGHHKKDRLFDLIERMKLPTVFFAEGGGDAAMRPAVAPRAKISPIWWMPDRSWNTDDSPLPHNAAVANSPT